MTTYTDVFGGDAVPPSDNRYVAVALTADTTFSWPELASGSDLMADIMEVTSDAAWSMTFPAANVVSTGRDVLVCNLGAYTITLKDSAGGAIGTVAAGVSKYLYITDNSTAAGSWTVFTFGTGTSAADAATLAGYGLVATGSTLSQQYSVTSTAVTTTISATADRARTIVFTNSGAVTCNLPSAATAGNGFFVNISNQGTGAVTLDGSGGETIDGATTKDLAPGESCTVVCNAVLWASIGYGRSTQFQFTKLVLDISAGTPFTLTSVQAENKLIQTIGTITAAVTINVPAVVAVYYVQCSHTGAFDTTFKTAAGTGVVLTANTRAILYCDGSNVVEAQTSAVPSANLAGGTAGAVVYQSSAGVTAFTAVGTAGHILVSDGTGAPVFGGAAIAPAGLTVSGAAFTSRGITDNATATALTLSGSGANSVTIANSANNPTIGTTASALNINPANHIVNVGAGAANFLVCYGNASGAPGIQPGSAASDVSLAIFSKGTGAVNIGGAAGTADYLTIFSAAGYAGISAGGSSSDVQLSLAAKGTSGIAMMTAGSLTQVFVAHTASAVRYLTLTGAAAGGNPTIGVSGGSLAVSCPMVVSPGAGNVFSVNNGYVDFSGRLNILTGQALPAGGSVTVAIQATTSNIGIYYGSGAPTVAAACIGSLYLRSDGGASTRLYSANSTAGGAGSWSAITSA